ncbi:vitamin B12 independent methionine synthase [Lacticaseibacillus pabuli]|uniref:Vitamin B12 independent methionine synthase n=1 Tax=Lacticaseibacillus pabuli TaxID=3025672 RepID=A0ABY7WUE7_9LACO|nr:vitamin B12 independent methionine synthase [Lacticaseibacillus sp. KACC 23028]WDF83381.1 vitamin B12 independent methionine synthase [Lacticaseibacillus sp. KACC 23028]
MTKLNYKFDQVGSYLRPAALKQAHKDFAAGNITADQLTTIKHTAIKQVVAGEVKVGLKDVTDGEFNRSWWHLDFLWNLTGVDKYDYEASYKFHGSKTRTDNVELTGKIAANPDHPFYADFDFLKSLLPDGVAPKVTIPSPSMLFRDNRSDNWHQYYTTWGAYLNDLAAAYHDTLLQFYARGARYIQLDDTTWAFLIAQFAKNADDPAEYTKYAQLAEDIVYVINKALAELPDDLKVSTHICRGNFKSTYLFEGSYAAVADYLGQLNYDAFFLEYDNPRSGDFEPIAKIWNNRPDVELVLGLVTSKFPELEDKATVEARIKDASQYVPLGNLALSTQCGFASTEEGNALTEDDEWAKLALIRDITTEVWA